jgi:hypothetical protein
MDFDWLSELIFVYFGSTILATAFYITL